MKYAIIEKRIKISQSSCLRITQPGEKRHPSSRELQHIGIWICFDLQNRRERQISIGCVSDKGWKTLKQKLKTITRKTKPATFDERIEKLKEVQQGWL
ncbi:MAG: hypothetical protein VB102_09080 [Paludibacter sp.]|nr:hypothetical protein [Paludibacter sp.]